MGSLQINKRNRNRSAVLHALHYEGSQRRGKIGTDYGIRKSSITSIVAELVELGLVREERPGNPRSVIALDTRKYYAIAASVTPRDCRFGRVYLDGRVEAERTVSLGERRDSEHVMCVLGDGLEGLLTEEIGCPLGIGVAVPGTVDPARGLSIYAANMNVWRNVPLGDELAARIGKPVYVDNDVRCQLWSCAWFDRLSRDSENTIYVNIHDGVACAIITHGERIVGEHFSAGEIGHIRVGEEGRLCRCGRTDCLEAYCSVPAILGEIKRVRPEADLKSAADIALYAAEDVAVVNVVDRVSQRLARALSGLVAAVDPHTLALGTPDTAFSQLLHKLLERHLYTELIGMNACDARVSVADVVEVTTLKGIAGLVIDRAFSSGVFSLDA